MILLFLFDQTQKTLCYLQNKLLSCFILLFIPLINILSLHAYTKSRQIIENKIGQVHGGGRSRRRRRRIHKKDTYLQPEEVENMKVEIH